MKAFKKILYSLLAIAITLVLASMCIEAASNTAVYSVDERRTALTWFFTVLVAGFLSVIAIWLPWKKWRG
ncbi:MAG: hypothetical protein KAZ71_07845 [Bacteroidia bacterium]|jgi:hypothetical protein|nr:hypothetical protein [Bacteroidia bacterium]